MTNRPHKNSAFRRLALPAAIGLLTASPLMYQAHAQEEPTLALEEVIVTARKREESLLDIPESVVAISGADIERQNIKGLNKIGMAVPNMNLSMRADGYPNVSIRGVGAFGLTQGVGFYLDDVQLFGDASSRFGDLDRIEVLKGPQGVLYGGSNIGGAVKYVSTRPSTEALSGSVKLLAGEQSIVDGEGSINIPLSDTWAIRAFGFSRTDDGFMTNPNSPSPVFGVMSNQDKDVGSYDELGGRLAIAGDITDNLSLHAAIRYNEYDGPVNNWSRELGKPSNMNYSKRLDTDRNPTHERDTTGVHLELVWQLDSFDVTSITSYTDTDSERITDVDLTQLFVVNTRRPETVEVVTQEFRFSSTGDGDLSWVGGVYARDFEETMNSTQDLGWILLGADDPSVSLEVPFETRKEDKSNLAAFGNITYDWNDWEFGAGVRVDRWESEEINYNVGEPGNSHRASRDETEVLPRLSITRNFDNGSIAYFTAAQGYEPGGWNTIADGAPPVFDKNGNKTLAGFDPEEAVQYELGWKGELLDGRASATVAIFYNDYDDRQFEFITPNPSGDGTLIEGIVNVGDSEQMGIEFTGALQAHEYLLLTAAAGYIDAEWDNGTINPDGVDLSGDEPPNIVGTSVSFTSSFNMPLTIGFNLVADFQISYNGEMEGGAPGGSITNPSYTVADIQIGMTSANWEFMVNVDNVTDEEYYTDLQPFPNLGIDGLTGEGPEGIIIGTHGHPRLVTASVTYSF